MYSFLTGGWFDVDSINYIFFYPVNLNSQPDLMSAQHTQLICFLINLNHTIIRMLWGGTEQGHIYDTDSTLYFDIGSTSCIFPREVAKQPCRF